MRHSKATGSADAENSTAKEAHLEVYDPLFVAPVVPAHRRARADPHTPRIDLADQLIKLAGLRDHGILTEAEFQVQKAKLLA